MRAGNIYNTLIYLSNMLKEVSVGALLEKVLRARPDALAIGDAARYRVYSKTYSQLHDLVQKCRSLLEVHNVKENDRVLLLGANSSSWLAVFFACIKEGIVIVPLDYNSSPALIQKIQKEVKAKMFFNDRNLHVSGAQTHDLAVLEQRLLKFTATTKDVLKRVPGDLLEIVYTSGTTGVPKGVMLTHKNILANIEALMELVKLPSGLRMVSVLPLSHMFQQIIGVMYPLAMGEQVILTQTVLPSRLAELIKTRRIHALIAVPGVLESMKKHIERTGKRAHRVLGFQFRLIGVGGVATPVELHKWWKKQGVKVLEGYGLTETGPIVSLNTLKYHALGSAGKPLPDVTVQLGKDNEIQVRGDNVMKGYYKNDKATQAAFTNGFLKTGDQGEIKDGFLYIKGRIKDMIVTPSGVNVYPEDVEHVLNKIPGVIESCVIEHNKKVHAVLLLKNPKKEKSIIAEANKQLESAQKIFGSSIWKEAEFPKTPTGKIRKFQVKEKIKSKAKPALRHGDPVVDIAQKVLKHPLKPKDKLVDKGMDSLARVELVAQIEQELGAELEETALSESATVSDLKKLVSEQSKGYEIPRFQLSWIARFHRAWTQPIIHWFIGRFAKTSCDLQERISNVQAPAIFVCNHTSAWDTAVVISCLPKRFKKIAIPAAPDFVFNIPPKGGYIGLWRKFVGFYTALHFNAYPFGKEVGVERSMRFTGELLDKGYSILIFPEARRTRDGKVQPFHEGIGLIAKEMRLPIIPIKIKGLFAILPYPNKIPKMGKVNVTFGMPKTHWPRMSTIEIAEQLEESVRKL